MKTTKLYPTKAEIKYLEEIKKRFNLKENILTGHISTKPNRSGEFKHNDLDSNTYKAQIDYLLSTVKR